MPKVYTVNIYRNGNFSHTNKIETLSEVKAFCYGIREIVSKDDIVGMVHAPMGDNAMIVQEMGKPMRSGYAGILANNEQFLRKFKKSEYAKL